MKNVLKLRLKSGERLFVNGAVMQVDRRVSLSFLNDVTFLLEAYVIQPEEATTPLRKFYFVIQSMLIDPKTRAGQQDLLRLALPNFAKDPRYGSVLSEIERAAALAGREQYFDALKLLRSLFYIEMDEPGASAKPEPAPVPAHVKEEVSCK